MRGMGKQGEGPTDCHETAGLTWVPAFQSPVPVSMPGTYPPAPGCDAAHGSGAGAEPPAARPVCNPGRRTSRPGTGEAWSAGWMHPWAGRLGKGGAHAPGPCGPGTFQCETVGQCTTACPALRTCTGWRWQARDLCPSLPPSPLSPRGIRQIWSNCREYNLPTAPVVAACTALEAAVQRQWIASDVDGLRVRRPTSPPMAVPNPAAAPKAPDPMGWVKSADKVRAKWWLWV